MSKLSIALLHYSCPPVVGGVEEVIGQQASLFHRKFYPVKIMAGSGGNFDDHLDIEINPLLNSRHPEIMKIQQNLPDSRNEFQNYSDRILTYLRETLRDFDVLIAHNVLTMPYNLPLTHALHRLAGEKTIRVVAWNHDSPYFYPAYPAYLDGDEWQILRKANPLIYYIVISASRAEQFRKLYGNEVPLRVIPNGVDPIRFFHLDPLTVKVIEENQLFSAEMLLVQPSRLHPRKNIELSIRVIRALQDKNVKARLLLTGAYDPHETGTVSYAHKLRELARQLKVEDDILIMADYESRSVGKITPHRIIIRDLYLIADLLFMPSIQEGFGIPLLEAGMIKLPIVCSDIPPFREIGGENVIYFSLEETPAQIADKIISGTRRLTSYRMYRHVMNHFAWDNIYRRELLPFLNEIQ